jgi:DNA primase
MILPETVAKILETARIEEVVGDFVTLKKRGVNLLGLCPFHNEKTPSFTVSPVKGIYKCFGCSKAGNAVNFIMEHEHYTYPEALRYLARKYQIEIEETEQKPEEVEAQNERESLFLINTFAQKYYSQQLFESEEGKAIGLSYLKERGFTTDIIKRFQLGFATSQWDGFTKAALAEGYKKEFLVKLGLSIEKEDRVYDRFRSRVMFPVHNQSGRVVGFTGRILTNEKDKPKYVNSPESEIYNKSKTLYGVYLARTAVARQDHCLLVEGNADVISLFQSGVENVVASSGTSLTPDQVRMLKRYTSNITILYDGDSAGIKAAMRGTEMILEEGMNVRIVLFPDGEDPDSFARKHRPAELEEFIAKNAVNFIAFKLKILLEESKNDPIKKAGLIKDIVHTISLIPDPVSRGLYLRQCSEMMNIPEQTLVNALNQALRKKVAKAEPEVSEDDIPENNLPDYEQSVLIDPFNSYEQEKYIVQLLLNYGNVEILVQDVDEEGRPVESHYKVAEFIVHDMQNDELEFEDPSFNAIYKAYTEFIAAHEVPDEKYFINHPDASLARLCISLIESPYVLSENWTSKHRISVPSKDDENRHVLIKDIMESLLAIRSRRLEKMIRDVQEELKEQQNLGNIDDVMILLSKDKTLKEAYSQLNRSMGRIIPR